MGQRVFGLVLGYEDLNDHDELRKDPTLAVLAGKLSPVLRTDCEALAGKSTLNRLEHTPKRHASKYHKIDCDGARVVVFGLARNSRLETALAEQSRRIHFALASGCPNKIEFEMAHLYLRRAFNSS